ncbi:metal/formaldehyde-sensitive transcriptional repressor [Acidovorax sp. NCPPB 2350]|nr:metal/formaldehyde-sensitive transcriptional repressor [Acidovorax sp. NCPPB 2350]
MAHTVHDKSALLKRIRRIQGQSQALERALEEEQGCTEVLQQIAAVRGAVNGLMAAVLEGQLRHHLADPEADPAQRERDLQAAMSAVRSYMK